MGGTVDANTPLVSDTALNHLFTVSLACKIEPAGTAYTSKVIIFCAVRDAATVAFQFEGSETVATSMVSLFTSATQEEIMSALPKDKRVI